MSADVAEDAPSSGGAAGGAGRQTDQLALELAGLVPAVSELGRATQKAAALSRVEHEMDCARLTSWLGAKGRISPEWAARCANIYI